MGLRIIEPPRQVAQVITQRVAAMASGAKFQTRRLSRAALAKLSLAAPHPVFNLAPTQVTPGADFEVAFMTGWRYFITAAGKVVALVEAAAATPIDRGDFAGISEGRLVDCAADLLAQVEQSAWVESGGFVLGMLRIPALYFHALWLRDEGGRGDRDVFIPLAPGPKGIEPGHAMSTAEMMDQLVDLKKQHVRAAARPTLIGRRLRLLQGLPHQSQTLTHRD